MADVYIGFLCLFSFNNIPVGPQHNLLGILFTHLLADYFWLNQLHFFHISRLPSRHRNVNKRSCRIRVGREARSSVAGGPFGGRRVALVGSGCPGPGYAGGVCDRIFPWGDPQGRFLCNNQKISLCKIIAVCCILFLKCLSNSPLPLFIEISFVLLSPIWFEYLVS